MNDPVVEPAAYWAGKAHAALTAFTRARQAELGLTHTQFCLLCALTDDDGQTISELGRAFGEQRPGSDDLAAEAELLLDQKRIKVDRHGRLWITTAGREACDHLRQHLPEITARIHHGIPDADYQQALSVLQQMIRNVS
ncbi:DNA-binding MarR family transcriptional regulator [Actinoplanes lutulentus]|uniref:DNA-binding MarR family transcriptional regulator n=1 Tax=Actinoplanes lutulentus TaxID=1287878 RepID=A0A327Z4W0_9ACTN|nr:MarR family winged helix-turn-helix transcriptional regulator [Actinoplanes lutulentus]RAK31351.1 DNA-binding MarR family transcriptional regulator [Actinoplanes lutulentus]